MSALAITEVGDSPMEHVSSEVVPKAASKNNKKEVSNIEDKKVGDKGTKVKVKQRNYILNDVGALKKKLKHENKKHEITIGKEAKDCSNITVPMRASFFEYVKANFILDLQQNENILNIENAEAAKASTESNGDAYVEYSMDITFKAGDITHSIKLTAYTTSSQLYIQPIREKSGPKDHLDQKGVPRYFVETFLLPWSEKVIQENKYNETIQKVYIDALKEEIKKLDMMKLDQKKASRSHSLLSLDNSKGDAKCAAKNCSFQGINPQNKTAVGTCENCGNVEHFACVKIKASHKEDITKGIMKYYCSGCLSKNPMNPMSQISGKTSNGDSPPVIQASRFRPRIDSLPLMGQGYLFNVTKTTTATKFSLKHKNTKEVENPKLSKKKCESCDYEANTTQELGEHIKEHKPFCTNCDKVFMSVQDLQDHVEKEHRICCDSCEKTFLNKSYLKEHMKIAHGQVEIQNLTNDNQHKSPVVGEILLEETDDLVKHKECQDQACKDCIIVEKVIGPISTQTISNTAYDCSYCSSSQRTKEDIDKHIEEEHTLQCPHCDRKVVGKVALDLHIESHTSLNSKQKTCKCTLCEAEFSSINDMEEHLKTDHIFHCTKCEISVGSSSELDEHHKLAHSPKVCTVCEITFNNMGKLNEHMELEHMFTCEKCPMNFKAKSLLNDHLEKQHNSTCSYGNEKIDTQNRMSNHIETVHETVVEISPNETPLDDPIIEETTEEHLAYHCNLCEFFCQSEGNMEDHILETHAVPDEGNQFKCDDCAFQTKDKEYFGKHFKETHGSESKVPRSELKNLEDQLRIMKNNFERLEGMYQEALEETNQVKSEYEARLLQANDSFTVIKAENEVLKERVDILFKLGRSYLEKSNGDSKEQMNDNEIEVIEVDKKTDDDQESIENLQTWSKNKMRGFRRETPASRSVQKKESSRTTPAAAPPTPPGSGREGHESPQRPQRHPPSRPEVPNPAHSKDTPPNSSESGRVQYCHYFVNKGRCTFEEKTGKKCKFVHDTAPMCNFGRQCTRLKCMFSHPKTREGSGFLGRRYPPMMNPWPIMNPWMTTPPGQALNPWTWGQRQSQNV